eukprot:7054544-Alexandrium_andersonii.AAC.1
MCCKRASLRVHPSTGLVASIKRRSRGQRMTRLIDAFSPGQLGSSSEAPMIEARLSLVLSLGKVGELSKEGWGRFA